MFSIQKVFSKDTSFFDQLERRPAEARNSAQLLAALRLAHRMVRKDKELCTRRLMSKPKLQPSRLMFRSEAPVLPV